MELYKTVSLLPEYKSKDLDWEWLQPIVGLNTPFSANWLLDRVMGNNIRETHNNLTVL